MVIELNSRGSVLAVSLWMVGILALLAGGILYRLRLGARLAQYGTEDAKLTQIAYQAVRWTAERVRTSGEPMAEKVWPDPPVFAEGSWAWVQLPIEEESKINLNTATAKVLENLLAGNAEAAAAIQDWRDADGQPRPGGAESDSYPNGLCRNGPFRSVEEALLVKGIDKALGERLRAHATVFGAGRVHAGAASTETLKALGFSEPMVRSFERRGAAESPPAAFDSMDEFRTWTKNAEDEALLADLTARNLIGLWSEAFRLAFWADTGKARRRFEIVATPAGKILSWSEGY